MFTSLEDEIKLILSEAAEQQQQQLKIDKKEEEEEDGVDGVIFSPSSFPSSLLQQDPSNLPTQLHLFPTPPPTEEGKADEEERRRKIIERWRKLIEQKEGGTFGWLNPWKT